MSSKHDQAKDEGLALVTRRRGLQLLRRCCRRPLSAASLLLIEPSPVMAALLVGSIARSPQAALLGLRYPPPGLLAYRQEAQGPERVVIELVYGARFSVEHAEASVTRNSEKLLLSQRSKAPEPR